MSNGLRFVCLKSYGDFVIAAHALRGTRANLVAGGHLHALATALGIEDRVHWLGSLMTIAVPAAFDVRQCGLTAAARSLMALRKAVAEVPDGTLVFDRLHWRERFVSGAHAARALPDADNIYLAYNRLVSATAATVPTDAAYGGVGALIIPGSRLLRKQLPVDVIARLYARLSGAGIAATVLLLDGEHFAPMGRLPVLRLPRSFVSLCNALRDAALVISADSLPAHLAEYLARPAFVLSPTPNTYWLPPRAFAQSAWSTFNDSRPFDAWLSSLASVPAIQAVAA
jgi:hypothetical protein